MERQEEVLEAARELVKQGGKPSVEKLSQELQWPEEDIHRCLNILEKDGEVETYTREILGKKMRMVGVYR